MAVQNQACTWRQIEKYKVRFLTQGFSQKEGIDYEETFALVARYTSVKTILAIAASKG